MGRWSYFVLVIGLATALFSSPGAALEKVQFSSPAGLHPFYVLPVLAAQDKGIWSELGLEVVLNTPPAGTVMYQAVVAGQLQAGFNPVISNIHAGSVGVPVVAAADMGFLVQWFLWVQADSPLKELTDFKGAKIGILRFGGPPHMYAMTMMEALGLGKDFVKYVALGGIRETTAALRTGAIQGTVLSDYSLLPLVIEGRVRALRPIQPYLPSPWIDIVLWSEKGFASKKSEVLKRVITGAFKGAEVVMKERDWAVAKMKSALALSDEVAQRAHPILKYAPTTKIDPRGMENVRNYLIQYKAVVPEKTPATEELYLKW